MHTDDELSPAILREIMLFFIIIYERFINHLGQKLGRFFRLEYFGNTTKLFHY